MIAAVVLSAGASTRMGRPKALLAVADGRSFAEAIAASARAGGAGEVLFVLGPPHGEAIRAALPAGCRAAWNPDPGRGMLSSIQAGIAALHNEAQAALVWPVDLPLVAAETVGRIASAPAGWIVAPQHEGRGGHPLRIPRDLFPALQSLPHEAGLRGLLLAHPGRVLRLPVDDPATLHDVDTPGDYARLLGPGRS